MCSCDVQNCTHDCHMREPGLDGRGVTTSVTLNFLVRPVPPRHPLVGKPQRLIQCQRHVQSEQVPMLLPWYHLYQLVP